MFDVTRLVQSGLHTGIQRVVRSLLAACAARLVPRGYRVLPVRLQGDQCWALPYLQPHPLQTLDPVSDTLQQACLLQPGERDILLMFDASWYIEPWPAVDALLRRGVRLCGMVHDLLPLERPEWFRPGLQPLFSEHLQALAQRAEQLFVPTTVVRMRLLEHLQGISLELPVNLLPHGGDFYSASEEIPDDHPQLESLPAPTAPDNPLYVVLGTLEPRKNHGLVLDAFEQLWAQGFRGRLLFVGQVGWQVDELRRRIESHPRRERQLFHVSRLSDPALHWLLGKVAGLIYLSRDEGFGLPVLEAAMRGCPVIASDIPVLREVGGAWPWYVGPDDPQALAHAVKMLSSRPSRRLFRRTWGDVALHLAGLLDSIPDSSPPHAIR